ncbi:MAG: DUF5666 domain-containing protein [Comamonadaceae bacterium]
MSKSEKLPAHLTRRSWMVLAASAVTAGCGGGGPASMAGLPGTGGTGLFAQGAIAGFGSVIINAIKFDDTLATVLLDGQSAASADLRLGMVASIQGQRGSDATLGIANRIEVWSIAQGLVSSGRAAPGSSGQFTLAGMTVLTDLNTIFEGNSATTPVLPGQRLAVWGLQAGADARTWSATRVATVSAAAVVSTGLVSVVNSQRSVNGLLLTGDAARALALGDLVRVNGILSTADGSLALQSVQYPSGPATSAQQGEAEIEGWVTSVAATNRFSLGGALVDASQATFDPVSAPVAVGSRVEVSGVWQGGVLKATKVQVQNVQELETVEISGRIQEFTSLANFVVRGQPCDASALSVVRNGKLTDLKLGASVKLTGTKAGDVLKVIQIDLI